MNGIAGLIAFCVLSVGFVVFCFATVFWARDLKCELELLDWRSGRVVGDVNLVLRIGGEGGPKSSSAWDHEDSQSQSVTCFGYVDANVTPKIEALVQGYRARDTNSDGGTVQFVQSSELNRIMVQGLSLCGVWLRV